MGRNSIDSMIIQLTDEYLGPRDFGGTHMMIGAVDLGHTGILQTHPYIFVLFDGSYLVSLFDSTVIIFQEQYNIFNDLMNMCIWKRAQRELNRPPWDIHPLT